MQLQCAIKGMDTSAMPTPLIDFSYARELRAATPRKLSRISDGDTPVIEQPIRMVSCDTPEKSGYAGKPEISQPKLDNCLERLENGYYDQLPGQLRNYLIRRLKPDAAARHIRAADGASAAFNALLEQRLTRPNGSKRNTAIIPTGEMIDRYGRLLAYVGPWFSGSASDPLPARESPDRRTFNLDMVENGWAAFFPVYPSLPQNPDFNLAIRAAEAAWNGRRGAWAESGRDLLLAYEYRACIKLGTAKTAAAGIRASFQRICVDLRDLNIKGLYGFHAVPPPYRLWVWQEELAQARIDLGLSG